jgi:hypothetical protein
MAEENLKRITLKPSEVREMFGIPEGTLANLRWAKRGPRYFKRPGGRGVCYLRADVEAWLFQNPVLTTESIKAK